VNARRTTSASTPIATSAKSVACRLDASPNTRATAAGKPTNDRPGETAGRATVAGPAGASATLTGWPLPDTELDLRVFAGHRAAGPNARPDQIDVDIPNLREGGRQHSVGLGLNQRGRADMPASSRSCRRSPGRYRPRCSRRTPVPRSTMLMPSLRVVHRLQRSHDVVLGWHRFSLRGALILSSHLVPPPHRCVAAARSSDCIRGLASALAKMMVNRTAKVIPTGATAYNRPATC